MPASTGIFCYNDKIYFVLMAKEELQETNSDGSVSLNLPTSNLIQPTSAQPAEASFSLDDSLSSGANNLAVDDIHVPINGGADPFGSKDGVIKDLVTDDETDKPATSSFFSQPNFKLWSGILGTSLVLLVGVFFFLAQQTTLFQGAITQILDDEPILEDTEPVIDTTSEGSGLATEPIVGGTPDVLVFNEIETGEGDTEPTIGDLPTIADDNGFIGEPIVDDNDLANLLAETTTSTQDTIIIGDNSPTIDLTTNTTPTDGTIVINDPSFNNPANVPTDSIIIAGTGTSNTAQANLTNSIPTLNSNTNSQVLGSAEVQGNTGPGMLVYFTGPLGFVIYRKLKKYAA